jgi:D-3-phosphoglycerate dehydrogenase
MTESTNAARGAIAPARTGEPPASRRLRILVAGDPYIPSAAFAEGLEPLAGVHEIEYFDVDMQRAFSPLAPSERRIREFAGSPAELAGRLDGHDVLVVHGAAVTDEVLAASPLRLVCCARGGPVNVDIEAAVERGIAVTTTPGKNAHAVVELTLAFLIMLARGIGSSQRKLLAGARLGESAFEGAEFFGVELSGRTLGLVGYGNVGRGVAAVAGALGMQVVAHDPWLSPDAFAESVESVGLEELLARSEFVSLHARVTPENENLMDTAAFARMRPGSFLINTARETLVDEAALLAAVKRGALAGAALDVVRPSTRGSRNPLLDEPRVVITPHIGGATAETIERGVAMVVEELGRLSAGLQPAHPVARPPS